MTAGLVYVDIVDNGDNVAVLIDNEVALGIHVKPTEVKNELTVQKDPNIVVAAEPELFGAIGTDFHWYPHVGSEMEIVAGSGGRVVIGKGNVIKWECSLATIFVGVVARAMEGNFAFIEFRKLLAVFIIGFVEPTIEVVGG